MYSQEKKRNAVKNIPKTEIVGDGHDIFVVRNGIKIAKRGHPDTPQAKTWVSLEPGWTVRDANDMQELEVSFVGVRVH